MNLRPESAADLARLLRKRRDALLRADWPFAPERLTVVDGALDALSRIVEITVRLGDRVAMENPGFPPLIDLLDRAGAEVIPLAMDDEGVLPDAMAAALQWNPVAMFLQPRAQNPTGISMTRDRARVLSAVLERSTAIIVEDDHSGDIATGEDVKIGRAHV